MDKSEHKTDVEPTAGAWWCPWCRTVCLVVPPIYKWHALTCKERPL